VDECVWWFITMERSCQAQLMAEAAGTPVLIDADQAERTSKFVGNTYAGWLSFQAVFVDANLYDPMTASLLFLRGLAPQP